MPEQIDHIEELQKRLYARDPESVPKQKFGILRPVKQTVNSTWGEKDIPKNRGPQKIATTGYRRLFIFSFIFFLIALGLALFSVFRGAITLSSKNVDLTVLGNSFVAGGEELPIQVEIANKNSSDLVDAVLTLEYPKGATDETGTETARLVENLGTIAAGKSRSAAFSTVLYGEQGLSRTINATLAYHLAGSTATFEKKQITGVAGRLRSEKRGIVARMAGTSNPGGAHTLWLKDYFIDKLTDKILQDNPRYKAEKYTFLQAMLWDNPYYMDAGYMATLQSLPEPLRSQMLLGDFHAGMQDDPWQVIPTEWVRLAQKRWMERKKRWHGPIEFRPKEAYHAGYL